jgi:C4-dicarboxylate transporter DctQ subunit
MLKWIYKIDAFLTVLERTTVALLLLVAVLILVGDVALRAVFGISLAWAAELTRYAIVLLVFIGGSIGARSGAHISIDVLGAMLPPKPAQRLAQIAALIAAGTTAMAAWYGWTLVVQMRQFGQTSPSLEWPMWIVYLAIPVGCTLMSLRFVQNALFLSEDIRRLSAAQSAA